MQDLKLALSTLSTAGEAVAVIMRALKVVLGMYEARVASYVLTSGSKSESALLRMMVDIDQLLSLASDLGAVAATTMVEARAQAAPLIADVPSNQNDPEVDGPLSVCLFTLQVFEETERSIALATERVARDVRSLSECNLHQQVSREATVALDTLLWRLRQRASPA